MPHSSLDRRTLIRTAGAVGAGVVGAGAVAACGSGSDSGSAGPGPAASSASGTSAGSSPAGSGTGTGGASAAPVGLIVAKAGIPVGGGTIIADSLVVVTQPVAGTFKAFGATCPHQGCPVTKVADGLIDCPCHGSQFDITTGQPTQGPATRPLTSKTVTVSGSNVVIS